MSKVEETIVDFSNHPQKVGLLAKLGALTGPHWFSVRPYKPQRSQRANRYYFGVVIPTLLEFMRAHGQFFTKDEAHEFLLREFAGRNVIDPITGEFLGSVGNRSSKMDTDQFADYVNNCIGWMQDRFGIVVPDPSTLDLGAERSARHQA